jgi:SAM-dependent methyltransferase
MTDSALVSVYDSKSDAYHDAFGVFLRTTDQKTNARRWLDDFVGQIADRLVLIDAGAGNGQVTAWLLDRFERTIAIEPNPSLNADLMLACPRAEILSVPILKADPGRVADLVLCSHVLYYIPQSDWETHVQHMASWLVPAGALIIVLQNPDTDCMRMLDHFLGRHFDLGQVADMVARDGRYHAKRHLVPAHVTTSCPDEAYTVAEFMLNLLPITQPPSREALKEYVMKNFRTPEGEFRFSCHQDFLVIRPAP